MLKKKTGKQGRKKATWYITARCTQSRVWRRKQEVHISVLLHECYVPPVDVRWCPVSLPCITLLYDKHKYELWWHVSTTYPVWCRSDHEKTQLCVPVMSCHTESIQVGGSEYWNAMSTVVWIVLCCLIPLQIMWQLVRKKEKQNTSIYMQ